MLGWGVAIAIGLWLVFSDMKPVNKARLAGNPMMIHLIVIGSGLLIHGGSADGAMAAIVSGIFSAIYFKFVRMWSGYIKNGTWYPGIMRRHDPRTT
jgi:hypothetical protein